MLVIFEGDKMTYLERITGNRSLNMLFHTEHFLIIDGPHHQHILLLLNVDDVVLLTQESTHGGRLFPGTDLNLAYAVRRRSAQTQHADLRSEQHQQQHNKWL